MSFKHLDTRREDGVELLTLNRPEVRNAFDDALIQELIVWADDIARDASVRAVVLAGAGPAFSAGADIGWMARTIDFSVEDNARDAMELTGMFERLNELPMPLIGRIHGAVLGGGLGLVSVCDIVVAADDARFGFTEVKLGILPAAISPFAVAKVGESVVRELFLTGRRFDAARALEIGLVHRVVPARELDAAVAACLAELGTSGPRAVAGAKALIRQVVNQPSRVVRTLTADTIARHRTSPEGQEGLRAFLEKRKASWAGTTDSR